MRELKMLSKKLPKNYMGYSVEELLEVLKELQGEGTKAPEAKIIAMSRLRREYKLTPVHQVSNGSLDLSEAE